MKTEVRYFTRSGNTAKLAEAIADAIGTEAKDITAPLDEKADILFLGSSVYGGGADDAVIEFIKANADKIGSIANFSTAALVSSTYKQIKKQAEEKSIKMLPEEFHCRGAFAFLHRGRPNSEDLKQAADFAKSVINRYKEK